MVPIDYEKISIFGKRTSLRKTGVGKTRRGAGTGAGDCLVKPGTGNREITCNKGYHHVLTVYSS